MKDNSLLPYSMRDESNLALEECINKAFSIDMTKYLTCLVDNLSDSVLYEKAKQFHVLGIEGWNECKTREDRENLVKNAIKQHRFKGTISSVKSIFKEEFEYLPWHEYQGTPNHFKLRMNVETPVSSQTKIRLSQILQEYKRLSSKMDEFEIYILLKDRMDINTSIIKARKAVIL
jgi:P2-related tail formation protein